VTLHCLAIALRGSGAMQGHCKAMQSNCKAHFDACRKKCGQDIATKIARLIYTRDITHEVTSKTTILWTPADN
jgi:hypothetical protein